MHSIHIRCYFRSTKIQNVPLNMFMYKLVYKALEEHYIGEQANAQISTRDAKQNKLNKNFKLQYYSSTCSDINKNSHGQLLSQNNIKIIYNNSWQINYDQSSSNHSLVQLHYWNTLHVILRFRIPLQSLLGLVNLYLYTSECEYHPLHSVPNWPLIIFLIKTSTY